MVESFGPVLAIPFGRVYVQHPLSDSGDASQGIHRSLLSVVDRWDTSGQVVGTSAQGIALLPH